MLDIKFIKQNKEKVEKAIFLKNIDVDINLLLKLNDERISLLTEVENIRADRNKNIDAVKGLHKDDLSKKNGLVEEGKKIKERLKELEERFRDVDKKFQELMLIVPNIPSEDTPVGKSEADNVEVKKWGEMPKFDFPLKNHIEIGENLDILDLDTGVKVSGFRGYYLKNDAVLLHFAVLWYALNKLMQKGFTPFLPPTLVNEFVLVGSGHFPFGKEEVYQIANAGKLESGEAITNPTYLVGTAEPSLLAYYSDKVLEEKNLPTKVCGISQCYRSEVGSYGKDVKGLYRIHEFMKVEQVVICKADIEESNKLLEEMRNISEEILQDLKLPYRVLSICTADMGAGKYKMYDIETWMPSRNSYGETHSDSNLTDWQTRRLNIKYLTKEGKKEYAFALNNTAIASPRILIAIMENCQQKDGSIKIPEVLRPYLGNKETIKKRQ
jgi:seryl-tRNA synthetase